MVVLLYSFLYNSKRYKRQLDNAIKFVESNSKKPWKKTDDNRIEMPDKRL